MSEWLSVDKLHTNKLVIENAQGEPAIILDGESDGEPTITLLGENNITITDSKILLSGTECSLEIFIKDNNPEIKITKGDKEWLWSENI